MSTRPPESIRTIIAPPGGIAARGVGSVTGDVQVWLDGATARVAYVGAEESYAVQGSARGMTLDQVAATLATDPGMDADGNPGASSLGRADRKEPADRG